MSSNITYIWAENLLITQDIGICMPELYIDITTILPIKKAKILCKIKASAQAVIAYLFLCWK